MKTCSLSDTCLCLIPTHVVTFNHFYLFQLLDCLCVVVNVVLGVRVCKLLLMYVILFDKTRKSVKTTYSRPKMMSILSKDAVMTNQYSRKNKLLPANTDISCGEQPLWDHLQSMLLPQVHHEESSPFQLQGCDIFQPRKDWKWYEDKLYQNS